MFYIIQCIMSFFASFTFGILFNVKRELLIYCGVIGAIGWLVYVTLQEFVFQPIFCIFVASFTLSLSAHILSKIVKKPVILFIVCGIIPLVPGGLAYETTKLLVQTNYDGALSKGLEALLNSGSIAIGIVASEIIFQLFHELYITIKRSVTNEKNKY
ncbi:threonine/serine exporter family protein [Abyssicoccus albus]|jgi:uncharacterized membrane protein YjjB (DUF3815 family)|uniref:Uncharacterized membrane protein YjjB (DUF3815 family) n=1 Tax=Abyssicoccus albus TaxID=1817405 RepID=A0A1Q1G2Y0_9BACL|nr:threonine/serine exporter family protein [Abyssicoccus albus]AQL56713.1 hypothetical protein BVH56_07175 [Abyssicoccus albus]RPF57464.1 uncharacterized membrane protein YjjB (DUF3815 family) [Abyssicoccus albus]